MCRERYTFRSLGQTNLSHTWLWQTSFTCRVPSVMITKLLSGKMLTTQFVENADCLGDREPRSIPTRELPHRVVLFWGWCANCRNQRERQNTHHPSFALAMLIVDLVGVVRGFRGLIVRFVIMEISESLTISKHNR